MNYNEKRIVLEKDLGIINTNQTKYNMNIGGTVRINPLGVTFICFFILLVIFFHLNGTAREDSDENLINMKQLLSVSIEAAKRGGLEVKKVREMANIGEKSKGKTLEGANNPVTNGDMLSHKAMYFTLKKAFPKLSVISEEHDDEGVNLNDVVMPSLHNSEVDEHDHEEKISIDDIDVWIDPLDATQEYTENLLHFVTTMVCVAVKGKPILGIIHKPFSDETAWGWAGPNLISHNVAKDVEENHPKDHKDLSLSRIIVSRSHAGSVHDVAEQFFGSEADVTPAGGAGYKSWEVIKGNQDVYVHVTLIKKWDICAGNAILNALGGQLTTLKGDKIDYSGKPAHEKNEGGVVAAMHDHSSYVDVLKSFNKDEH